MRRLYFALSVAVLACAIPSLDAAVINFGTVGPVNTSSLRIADLVQTANNQVAGLQAAFYEANVTNALNGNQVQLVVRDTANNGARVAFGGGIAAAVEFVVSSPVTAILLPSTYAIHTAVAVARPANVTILGGQSPETVLLYGAGSRNAVNMRLAYSSELLHMVKFAASSGILCHRFGVFYYNTSILLPLKDQYLAALKALGFTDVLSLPMQPPKVATDPPGIDLQGMLDWQPTCVLFISAADLIALFVPQLMKLPNYNPDIHWFGTSAANLPAYPPGLRNVYIMQQFPDPTDRTFVAVQKYQAAQDALFNRPGGFVPYPGSTASTVYNYDAFEGYIIGRFALEILKRVPNYSPQAFLDTVYKTKMYVVDDITIGPFSDGCIGRSSDSQLPCTCNSGARFTYISKIDEVTGVARGIADDRTRGEHQVAVSEVPMTKCTLDVTEVFRPYVFHLLLDAADTSSSTAAFAATLKAGINALRLASSKGSTVVLRVDSVDMSTQNVTRDKVGFSAFRFAPLAFIGASASAAMAVLSDQVSNVTNATNAQQVFVAPVRAVMPLTDADAALTIGGYSDRAFELAPVVADLVHTLAATYAAVFGQQVNNTVRVICATRAECVLGVRSINTFGIRAEAFVVSDVAAAVSAGTPASCTVLVSRSVADVSAAILASIASTEQVAGLLLVGAPEEVIDDALRSLSAAALTNVALLRGRVFFATSLANFWFTNTSATTLADASTLTEVRNALLKPTGVPTVAAMRAFHTAAFVYQASLGLTSFTPAAFQSAVFSRQTISTVDITMGPFYQRRCASTQAAAEPQRECECNKGPRRFSVYDVAAWAASLSSGPTNAAPVFTASLQFCGVDYKPLPTVTDNTAMALGLGLGLGLGALASVIVIAIIAWPKSRDNSAAPTKQPFAVVFTDIQSSTALWARAPQCMGQAVDDHHRIIRAVVKQHKGYEVKTIGDSFMVAFQRPDNAVDFGIAVQRALMEHNWGTSEIDQTYRELAEEIAQDDPAMAKLIEVDAEQSSKHWNGLRVRVGIHFGSGEIKFDDVSLGYDYYGTVVNTAARVEGVGHGGQVLITNEVREAMGPAFPPSGVATTDLGLQPLRGLDEPIQLMQLVPSELQTRKFGALRLDIEHAAELIQSISDSASTNEQGLSRTSSNAGKYGDGSSSRASSRIVEIVDPLAIRHARMDKKNPSAAYTIAMSNFHLLRTLFATSTDKYQRSTTDALLQKWRVKPERPSGKISSKALLDYNLMQLVLKVTLAAEATKREYVFPDARPMMTTTTQPQLESPAVEVTQDHDQPPGTVESS